MENKLQLFDALEQLDKYAIKSDQSIIKEIDASCKIIDEWPNNGETINWSQHLKAQERFSMWHLSKKRKITITIPSSKETDKEGQFMAGYTIDTHDVIIKAGDKIINNIASIKFGGERKVPVKIIGGKKK